MNKTYASLHNHTHYSLDDGIPLPEELYDKAVQIGLSGISITDHGNCNGIGEFLEARLSEIERIGDSGLALGRNVPLAIPGTEGYFGLPKRGKNYHCILLAKNTQGLSTLFRIQSMASLPENVFNKRPIITWENLRENVDGNIIATSACVSSVFARLVLEGELQKAEEELVRWRDFFGEDFYLELVIGDYGPQKEYNLWCHLMSQKHDIPAILTNDTHYLNFGDRIYQFFKYKFSSIRYKADRETNKEERSYEFLRTFDELIDGSVTFNDGIPEKDLRKYAEETNRIVDKCSGVEIDKTLKPPTIGAEDPTDLYEVARKELQKRGWDTSKEYRDRLDHEIRIIEEKGYYDYTKAFWKISSVWSSRQLSSARGSAGGSLFHYLIGLTPLDPVRYDLSFGRYLSESRNDPPDIDMDWSEPNEIKNWLLEEYGGAYVGTFTRFEMKGLLVRSIKYYVTDKAQQGPLLKDMSRSLEEAQMKILNLEKNRGSDKVNVKIEWNEWLEYSPLLRKFFGTYPEADRVCRGLFGRIVNSGCHAGGFVQCEDIRSKAPIFPGTKDGKIIPLCGYSEGTFSRALGDYGFLKLDILGLASLRTLQGIKELDIPWITENDPDNPDVYKNIYHTGNCSGIFQMGSPNAISLVKQIKPSNHTELTAFMALNRPGPLASGIVSQYAELRDNPKRVHPIIDSVLSSTGGIIVYQEQVMKLGEVVGDFTDGEQHELRKGLAKRLKGQKEDMKEVMRQKFVAGGLKKNIPETVLNKTFNAILEHARYSFNKTHSAAYAWISYLGAYAKNFYPIQFMESYFTHQGGSQYEVVGNIIRAGFVPKPPSYEHSVATGFRVVEQDVYLPFIYIKGIGTAVASKIPTLENRGKILNDMLNRRITKTVAIRIAKLESHPKKQRVLMGFVEEIYSTSRKRSVHEIQNGAMEKARISKYKNHQFELLGFNIQTSVKLPEIFSTVFHDYLMGFDEVSDQTDRKQIMVAQFIGLIRESTTSNGATYWRVLFSSISGEKVYLNLFFGEPTSTSKYYDYEYGQYRKWLSNCEKLKDMKGEFFAFGVTLNDRGFPNIMNYRDFGSDHQYRMDKHFEGRSFVHIPT